MNSGGVPYPFRNGMRKKSDCTGLTIAPKIWFFPWGTERTSCKLSDFFAFPSTTDTFGNVVLEAHASALPVILSDVGGPRDLIDDGVDGYVTRANDVEEFADRIRRLCEDAELRGKMGAAGRAKVESRDWQQAFERFWAASPE